MSVISAYKNATEIYAALGVDTDAVLETVKKIPISVHCWQGDDVGGFETAGASLGGGGIQVTGNYSGKAQTLAELRNDIEKALSFMPGKSRLSLHASYADFGGEKAVGRNELEPKHFISWVEWAKAKKLPLDFNSTFFSHPKAEPYTLTSPDRAIRSFWIEHCDRCRKIGEFFGKEQADACIHNIWVPDGMKDIPAERGFFRENLLDSLDKIFAKSVISEKYLKDSVESKVFGIGSESYVAGSHEFYMGYALSRKKLLTLDMGHFHPLESVADKISSIMLFCDEILLHVSRGIRWDSDHVVIVNDDLTALAREVIHTGKLEKIHIGLDFFDGSINRIGAWTLGCRSTRRALLNALLEPRKQLAAYELEGNNFARLALYEQTKTMPSGDVWNYFCESEGIVTDANLIPAVLEYEKTVLAKRG